MIMFGIAFEAILVVFGGVAAATVLCWLGWTAFKIVRHPEWGPPTIFSLLILALGGPEQSEFLRMVALFSAIVAIVTWSEGGAWRNRHPQHSRWHIRKSSGRS